MQSNDGSLIGVEKTYQVVASLTDYPTVTYTSADSESIEGKIQFKNPCEKPFTFDEGSQDNASNELSDNFSGTPINIQLNEFTITPSRCQVSYSCNRIVQTGTSVSSI